MEKQIKVLKISRSQVSHTGVLWDKIYLIPKKDESLISKIFDFSLVIPKTPEHETHLLNTFPQSNKWYNKKSFTYTEYPIKRQDYPEKISHDVKQLLTGDELIVIPILGRYDKQGKKLLPYYLSGKRHKEVLKNLNRHSYKSMQPDDFPEDAYIQTPTKKLKPICLACTNNINVVAGACRLGGTSCYEHLIFGKSNAFKEKYDAGKPRIDEDYKNLDTELNQESNEVAL